MAENHPDFVKVYPPNGAGSRSGDFDQVWQRTSVSAAGKTEFLLEHIVVEAKGGASGLGTRQAGPIRAQQGTREYFQSIVDNMLKGDAAMQKAAAQLDTAIAEVDKVKYVLVKVPIESGTLGRAGSASTVTGVVVNEFNLAPIKP
jgi:hypothetical protein